MQNHPKFTGRHHSGFVPFFVQTYIIALKLLWGKESRLNYLGLVEQIPREGRLVGYFQRQLPQAFRF